MTGDSDWLDANDRTVLELNSRRFATVADDVSTPGNVDLGCVRRWRTLQRREVDVDSIASRVRHHECRIRRSVVVTAADVASPLLVPSSCCQLLVGNAQVLDAILVLRVDGRWQVVSDHVAVGRR